MKRFITPTAAALVFAVILASFPARISAIEIFECPLQLNAQEPMYCVSMVQLLGNPEKFHNKLVRTSGFMHLEFEGNALYLHKQDFQQMLLENSIWLELEGVETPKFNSKYTIIEGTYLAGNLGHFGMFSGALTKISRIQKNTPRAEAGEVRCE